MLHSGDLHGPGCNSGITTELATAITNAARDNERPQEPMPVALEELPLSFAAYERECIVRTMRKHDGNKLAAAHALQVGKSTLYRRFTKHGLKFHCVPVDAGVDNRT